MLRVGDIIRHDQRYRLRCRYSQLFEKCEGVMAARTNRATTGEAFESLRGFDQMVVFEIAFLGHPMLPHVVGNLVTRPGCGHDGLGIQFTDAPGRKDGGVYAVGREEFEEAPDADTSAKLAWRLHGRLVLRRKSMASKSTVRFTAMRVPGG